MNNTTTTETLTADTITTAQIEAFRAEAQTAGDYEQVAICNHALDTKEGYGREWTVVEARTLCAAAINAARAMESVDAYVVWEGGIRHVETSESAARKSYEHLSRCGVPCSIYINDACHGSANGAGDVVDWDAVRDAQDAAQIDLRRVGHGTASPTGQAGRR